MKVITNNDKRRVSSYLWAYTNKHILYVDDSGGNENWRIYRVDVNTGEKLTLVDIPNVQARLLARSENHPEEMLVLLNQRNPEFHDVYRLNIINGKLDMVLENDLYGDFVADSDLNVKVATESTPDGGANVYALSKDPNEPDLKKAYSRHALFSIPQADMFTSSTIMINKKGDTLYMVDSRGRDTAALIAYDLNTHNGTVLGEDPKADITDVLADPKTKEVQAYSSTFERTHWKTIDSSIAADMEYLTKLADGEMQVVSRSLDDNTWIVAYLRDIGAPIYYLYDKPAQKAQFLFSSRPELDKMPLAHMDPVIIKSRDGLDLVSYLTLPKNMRTEKATASDPVPLIINVHGGPSARDDWGYDAEHQWLANRGYAVLSINYRGSTGFGKKFANAGNGEWGAKMHDDLIDGVNWALQNGITTKNKVAIMGGSFGGYATLVGLTKTPDVFACGIDIVGPSNLETLMKSIPAYWKPFYALLKVMIGADPETEQGREFLASRSPLFFVNNIKKPLLIGQGANDPRVKQAESDQIVEAMESKKIPVTYVLYPDEGHGFQRPENRMSFYAVSEAFLAKHLGGKLEPIKDDFKNSSIEIKVGENALPASFKLQQQATSNKS